jgi:CRP/FNR family transcriptional regulator, cyclic AMP receptor protein
MNLHGMGPLQGFWGLLAGPEQSVLSGLGRMSVFSPGAALCVEGDPATHVFILVAGWVKILAVTSEGQEMVLALRGNGDIVGELAGEATGYRTATMQAAGTVRALIVGHDKFSSFLDSYPGASHAYRRALTQRWSDTAAMLRRRSGTSGAQRLAFLLLDLAAQHGTRTAGEVYLAVPLSQEDLASLAGTSRATVTRALGNWRQRGFIRTGPRRITIMDPGALRQIAGHPT